MTFGSVLSPVAIICGLALGLCCMAQNAGNYQEPYRPQFHFSPRQHWTNDPNGLVYLDGEYHLFFQFNPLGDKWGHMSWGHAVSHDLVHWSELPVALPEQNGIMIFTGSTVVDHKNSSGFCKGGQPCLVAIYTGHTPETKLKPALQTQNLAWSNDHGRTWTKYEKNPVLNLNMSDFRDPKVLWSDQAHCWVMVVSLPNDHKVRIYHSPDLKSWTPVSDFGPAGAVSGQWECPELFELPVTNQPRQSRWVLKIGLNPGGLQGGSGEQYFVGSFDGTHFTNENPSSTTMWTDYGKDCYCGLTFNNLPKSQPQAMIAWMNNWQYANQVPTSPWRGQMTIPRKLSLRATNQGMRLIQQPANEFASLLGEHVTVVEQPAKQVAEKLNGSSVLKNNSYRLKTTLRIGRADEVGLQLSAGNGKAAKLGYDAKNHVLFFDRTNDTAIAFSKDFPARVSAPLTLESDLLRLDILVDRNSVEVFAGDGKVTLTNLVFPPQGASLLSYYSVGGSPGAVSADLWQVKSIWK